MARERNPNDPYSEDPAAIDPRRSTYQEPEANDLHRSSRLDQEMQGESPLTERRVGGGLIAAAAVGIVVLIGALYYGLNMSSTSPTSTATTPASQDSAQSANSAVRDVTPNRDAGTTTGSAPAGPQNPASPPSNSGTPSR